MSAVSELGKYMMKMAELPAAMAARLKADQATRQGKADQLKGAGQTSGTFVGGKLQPKPAPAPSPAPAPTPAPAPAPSLWQRFFGTASPALKADNLSTQTRVAKNLEDF